jgi:hypothetical protein
MDHMLRIIRSRSAPSETRVDTRAGSRWGPSLVAATRKSGAVCSWMPCGLGRRCVSRTSCPLLSNKALPRTPTPCFFRGGRVSTMATVAGGSFRGNWTRRRRSLCLRNTALRWSYAAWIWSRRTATAPSDLRRRPSHERATITGSPIDEGATGGPPMVSPTAPGGRTSRVGGGGGNRTHVRKPSAAGIYANSRFTLLLSRPSAVQPAGGPRDQPHQSRSSPEARFGASHQDMTPRPRP